MRVRTRIMVGAVFALAVLVNPLARAKPQQATVEQIRQLMQVTGTAKLMGQMMAQMENRLAGTLSKSLPCVPSEQWQDFINTNAQKELVDRMVPIYQHHLTQEDAVGLLKFYRSPLGQKMIHEQPLILQESMQAGSKWGMEQAERIVERLKKQGVLNDQGKCPAG